MQFSNVDTAITLLIVDYLDAQFLVLEHNFFVLGDLGVKLLLDAVGPGNFLFEAEVKCLILLGYVRALLSELFQLLLSILDVGVRLHVVHLVLLVELFVLVSDFDELSRGTGSYLSDLFDLIGR